jgi:hypothetical protein
MLGQRTDANHPGGRFVRTAEVEILEVCKDYAAGSQAPALTDFTVDVSGGTTDNFTFSLAPGGCAEVWLNGGVGVAVDNVTVTEAVPAGFTASYSTTYITNAGTTGPIGPVAGNSQTVGIGSDDLAGALIVFTNTPIPPPPLMGRMTGGGFQIYNDVRITRGFTIHCDIILSNNLEINWPGNRWHIDKPLTKATCIDDPAYNEHPPVAPFNTFIGEGVGRLNGVDGALVKFTFIDAGEPGTNDKASIQIWDVNGNLVLDVPLMLLGGGNIQAHYDQPHGQKP